VRFKSATGAPLGEVKPNGGADKNAIKTVFKRLIEQATKQSGNRQLEFISA
jgi:hypothetical protein